MSEQNEQNAAEPMLTKMSVKTLECMPTGGLPTDKTQPNPLCIIAGKATAIKFGEDGNGKLWTALVGSFRGTNLATGKSYRAAKLFLPAGIQEIVEAAVGQLPKDAGGAVKFAMRISSVHSTNRIGYSYQATNLIPVEAEQDELADLIKLTDAAANAPAQIEAPKGEEKAAAGGKKK